MNITPLVRTSIIFLLFMQGVFFSFAHSPDQYTTIIHKTGDSWKMQLTFSTHGILESMKAFYQLEELPQNTAEIEKLMKEYVAAHFELTINKHFKVSFEHVTITLSEHSSEVNMDLVNMPKGPIYWDLKVNACKEYESGSSNITIVRHDDHYDVFLLEPDNGYSVTAKMDPDGGLSEIKKETSP